MVKYIIWFSKHAKITFGDLLDEIDRDGDMFYVPKYYKDIQRWALLVHERDCVKTEKVLQDKCVQYKKEVCA